MLCFLVTMAFNRNPIINNKHAYKMI